MKIPVKETSEVQTPEVLDPETLAAIDKAGRWKPNAKGVTVDDAIERARKRNRAWRNGCKDREA